MYGILLSCLGWCSQLLLGIVRQTTKTNMQHCWSFTCCFSCSLGSRVYLSKSFDRVWHAGLLHRLQSCGISVQIFGHISSFLSNRCLWVVLDGKSSQEYSVNAVVPEGSILGSAVCKDLWQPVYQFGCPKSEPKKIEQYSTQIFIFFTKEIISLSFV